jgi:hypothetical protein
MERIQPAAAVVRAQETPQALARVALNRVGQGSKPVIGEQVDHLREPENGAVPRRC